MKLPNRLIWKTGRSCKKNASEGSNTTSGKWEERWDCIIDNANNNLCIFICAKENSLISFILSTDFIQQRENISLVIPREDFIHQEKRWLNMQVEA